ncbi:MAG: AAA family ATPase, partial [Lachnospiraceae bacterium]|nr:AAA family ATPase [Lachnospiraceae bacterium]
MKLISCYIENFGGLHQFSYDFTDGLNVILENNGWGKTTLAVFLKAMFFGLDKSTKRSLDENERKKYEPWNGGPYGGNLVFEADGIVYRVERFFAGKDKEDTFVLYDVNTGLESTAYSEKLGEELFGIDRIAFEQSIYMKQGEYAVSMTDSVATKMSGLMASGDDLDCYEKACARLEEEMKIYKKTGNKGKIAEVTEEIAGLNRRIADAKQTGATLDDWRVKVQQCYADIRELKTKKDGLKVQMRRAGEQAARQEKAKHYKSLSEEKDGLARVKSVLEDYFANGVPTEEELEQYRKKLYAYRNSEVRITEENYGYKYPELVKILERNPMTEEELDACEQKWNQVKEKENLLEKQELQLQSVRIREEEKNNYLSKKTDSYKVKQRISVVVAVLSAVLAAVLYFTVGIYGLFALGITLAAMVLAITFGMKAKAAYYNATDDNEELIQTEEEY